MAQPSRFTPEMMEEYAARGYWSSDTMVSLVERHATNIPQREALLDSRGSRLTWQEVKHLSDRIACGLLQLGISRDEAALVQLPNIADNFLLRIAFRKAGILCAFAPMTWRHLEIGHALKLLRASVVIIPDKYRKFDYVSMVQEVKHSIPDLKHIMITGGEAPPGIMPLDNLAQKPWEDYLPSDSLRVRRFTPFEVSEVLPTSGSTGLPKMCERCEASYVLQGRHTNYALKINHLSVVGIFSPLSGGPGLAGWCGAIYAGAKTVMIDQIEPREMLEAIHKEKVTDVSTMPTALARLLNYANVQDYDISSLRSIRCGAAALPATMAREMEQKLRSKVVPGAGSREVGIAVCNMDDPPEVRHNSVGKPVWGNEIRLVDEVGKDVPLGETGELLCRGACTSSGYYNDLPATVQAWGQLGPEGWYHTGDLARMDESGNLALVGRKKEIIIRGGQNIYPREIEQYLLDHPNIADVAIVAVPDLEMGERACACVVIKPGTSLTLGEINAFLQEKKVAPYKLPERLKIMEHLPTLADGLKIDRRALAQDITRKLAK